MMQNEETIKLLDVANVAENYGNEIVYLSCIFKHPIVLADDGVIRWKMDGLQNSILRGDFGNDLNDVRRPHNICLNTLARQLHNRDFSLEEYICFYMSIGYSLSGFTEVFGQKCDEHGRDLMVQLIEHHNEALGKMKLEEYNWRLIATEWSSVGMTEEAEEANGGYYKPLEEVPNLNQFLLRFIK